MFYKKAIKVRELKPILKKGVEASKELDLFLTF